MMADCWFCLRKKSVCEFHEVKKMKKTKKQWSDWDEWLDCGGMNEEVGL